MRVSEPAATPIAKHRAYAGIIALRSGLGSREAGAPCAAVCARAAQAARFMVQSRSRDGCLLSATRRRRRRVRQLLRPHMSNGQVRLGQSDRLRRASNSCGWIGFDCPDIQWPDASSEQRGYGDRQRREHFCHTKRLVGCVGWLQAKRRQHGGRDHAPATVVGGRQPHR